MKDKRELKYHILLIVIFIYVIWGTLTVRAQYDFITDYQYQNMGKNVLNLAELTAKTIKISNEEVEILENLSFEESQRHPLNIQFNSLFQLVEKNDSIEYAYILRKLPKDRVKYQVSQEDSEFYGLKVGTELDYIWLMDVIVDENQQKIVAATPDYYKDKNRYTTKQGEIGKVYEERKASYLLTEGEWGTLISGLVPLYSTEGDYVGLLGIDMYSEAFFEYRSGIFWTLTLLVVVPSLFLSFVYVYLYLAYRRKMNDLAYKDQLTGVFNRRYFDIEGKRLLGEVQKAGGKAGIIIGDIDDFKRFNDTYGHQEGDLALQTVAEILKNSIPGKSGFVARYGGEEFVLVVRQAEGIELLCHDICTSIEKRQIRHTDGTDSHVTISLGVWVTDGISCENLDTCIRRADQAMYQAKKSGKNTFVFAK